MKLKTPVGTFHRFDWITLTLYLSLVIIGWLMIYATAHGVDTKPNVLDLTQEVGKQSIFIAISMVLIIFTQVLDDRFWISFAYPLYSLTILLLIAVLVFGTTIKGATSWFSIAGFTLQPSEFAKFGTILAMSGYLSYYKTNLSLHFKSRIVSIALILGPTLLVLLQPDAGSALVFLSFFIVLYRAGMPAFGYLIAFLFSLLFIFSLYLGSDKVILLTCWLLLAALLWGMKRHWSVKIGILTLTIALSLFLFEGHKTMTLYITVGTLLALIFGKIIKEKTLFYTLHVLILILSITLSKATVYGFERLLKPHQQDRINVWLNPEKCDPHGALYNVLQSKIAIGSGGLLGKGFLQGNMSKLNYVPEQNTDFIFTVIGEEQGFLGGFFVIIMYALIIFRLITRAEKSRLAFTRYYAYGLAGVLFTHVIINIGMTIGIFPVIGIPLPFLSYGGSSLLAFSLMIGVYLKLSYTRR